MRDRVPHLLLSSFLLLLVGCGGAPTQDASVEGDLYQRIAVVGASASAGFRLPVNLADALDEAITTAHERPLDLASELTFLNPVGFGTSMIEDALEHAPTCVFAFDFPFWFGYGPLKEDVRMARLEVGLELLDRIQAPIVVGGFPDMHFAIGPMLIGSHVPDVETIVALDERVRAWADERPRVTFFDWSPTIVRVAAGETLEFDGISWPQGRATLLQDDRLHPTDEGLVMLTLELLRAHAVADAHATSGGFERDPRVLLESIARRAKAEAVPR